MYKHILIATDGSEQSDKAVDQGLRLAKHLKAKVTVVTVTEPPGFGTVPMPSFLDAYEKSAAENAARILGSVSKVAKKNEVACTVVHVKGDYPADGIINTGADKGCDLIVMGSHGHRGLTSFLLGSEATKVLTHSTVPIL